MTPSYAPLGVVGIMWLMKKRTISVERWRRVLAEQQSSGLSIAAICRRAEVSPALFCVWRRNDFATAQRAAASRPAATTGDAKK